MKPLHFLSSSPSLFKTPLAVCLLGMAAMFPTQAANLYWDADGAGGGSGGTGTWNTSSSLWRNGSTSGALQAWPTTDPSTSIAYFTATSALTIASGTTLYANGLNFGADTSLTSGDSSSKLVINGTSPTIALSTATSYLNTTVELTGSTTFTSSLTGNLLAIGRSTTTSVGTGSLTAASGIQTLFTSTNRGTLAVGQNSFGPLTGSSSGTVDFSGAQVNANLSALRVGQLSINTSAGSSTANVSGTFDYGSNSASTSNILTGLPVGIGLSSIVNNTHVGTVSGILNTQAGTHTYTSNQNVTPVVKIGEMTSDGVQTNGTNVSTVSGTWNISGGTTTLTPLAGYTQSTFVSILLANRTSNLGVNSTVSGTLNLTGGTLNVAGGNIAEANNTAGATSTVTLNGGTLNLNGGNIGLASGLIDTLNFQSGTLSNVGQINNGAVLNKTTSGTLRLNGTNSYTGGTTLSAGTLQAGSDTAFGSGTLTLTTGKFSSDSTTARAISNAVSFAGDVTLGDATNTGILTFNGAGTLTGNRTLTTDSAATYANAIGETGGARSLTKAGSGTLTLSGANTYTGGTAVNAGTLALGASERLANAGAVTVNGGAFDVGSFNETVGAVTLTGGSITGSTGVLTGTSYAVESGSISAILAGAVNLTKTTAGTVALTGTNTYSGTSTLSTGVLQAGNNAAFGTSALALNGGKLSSNSGTAHAFSNAVTFGGDVTLGDATNSGVLTFNGVGTLTGNRTVTTASAVTYAGAIGGGSNGLTKAGASTLTLSGANTYTGLTTVSDGTLAYGANDVISSGAVTVNGATAILALGANSDSVGTVTVAGGGSITGSGTLTSTGTFEMQNGSVSAILAGNGIALNKTTSSTVTLTGANSYTGGTTISAGTLALSGAGGLADTGAVTISGGTLALGGISDTVGAVTLSSGTISNGTLTGTSYSATNTGTVSAVLAGTGTFTKTGAGSVTFTAENTYTGATLVSEGGLILSGSGSIASNLIKVADGAGLDASAITGGFQLKNGQILQNKGTFTGSLTALAGSTYAPGNSPGTATQAGDLALNTGSTFEWELVNNTSAGAGTNFDQTEFTAGGLTIESGVTANLNFTYSGSTVVWADAFWSSNQQWLVFTGADSLATSSPEIFTTINVGVDSLAKNLADVRSGASFIFTSVGNDVYLTYSIPEPSTTLLLTGALTALVIFRRRRA